MVAAGFFSASRAAGGSPGFCAEAAEAPAFGSASKPPEVRRAKILPPITTGRSKLGAEGSLLVGTEIMIPAEGDMNDEASQGTTGLERRLTEERLVLSKSLSFEKTIPHSAKSIITAGTSTPLTANGKFCGELGDSEESEPRLVMEFSV